MKPSRYGILLALAFFCANGSPGYAASSWADIANSFTNKACTVRALQLDNSATLFSRKVEISNGVLEEYSDDLLLQMIFELEQKVGLFCELPPILIETVGKLKTAYLARLGLNPSTANDREILFRGLTVQESASNDLKKKIASLNPKPSTALDLLKAIYGQAVEVNGGIVFIGKDRTLFQRAKAIFETFPEGFDPHLIYRILFTEKDGVAAFVPELGLLLLSEKLVREENLLHRAVVYHELSHVWIRRWELEEPTYFRSYAALSGWSKSKGEWVLSVTNRGDRLDELTELSKGSAFSILPDGVTVPKKKGADGFVLQRSYDETKKRNDLSEDMADHIAIAFLVPERFCWNGRPLAKRKYEWVKAKVKRPLSIPSCLR